MKLFPRVNLGGGGAEIRNSEIQRINSVQWRAVTMMLDRPVLG